MLMRLLICKRSSNYNVLELHQNAAPIYIHRGPQQTALTAAGHG